MEQDIKNCPYCGGNVSLVSSSIVYNGRDFGLIYLCDNYPSCDAYVGVHKGTNRPLGRLANAELREWKKKAHAAFNPLYESGEMNRKQAYKLMQSLMNMDDKEAHIGKFDIEQCKTLIEKLKEYRQAQKSLQ
jgi:ssDNA-binding Zn-finger/Zn-ribbon topoisomerase 1